MVIPKRQESWLISQQPFFISPKRPDWLWHYLASNSVGTGYSFPQLRAPEYKFRDQGSTDFSNSVCQKDVMEQTANIRLHRTN